MSRVLILYASHYGQTRAIANAIADRLSYHGHEPEVVNAADSRLPTPQQYDAVIFGSRVELGRHAADIRNYIRAHIDHLEKMPTAFFSVSMSAARPHAGRDPSCYMATFFDDVEWHPTKHVAFAGALPYRTYGFLMRAIMKRISQSAGHTTDTSKNHEFTDWDQVRTFADELVAILPHDIAARWL